MAAIRRKRIMLPQTIGSINTSNCSTSPKAEKGHFVVHSADKKRFLLPLEYINNEMLRDLFNMEEEEFGLLTTRHLILPFDAELMESAIALIKKNVPKDVERAFFICIASSCSSSFYLQHQGTIPQLSIYSF